jgi:hypothetical protein
LGNFNKIEGQGMIEENIRDWIFSSIIIQQYRRNKEVNKFQKNFKGMGSGEIIFEESFI